MENSFNINNWIKQRDRLTGFLYVTLFCLAVAYLLYFLGITDPFLHTLVISLSIGWSITGTLSLLNTSLKRWLPVYFTPVLLTGFGTALGLIISGAINESQPFAYLSGDYAALILGIFFSTIGFVVFEARHQLTHTKAALLTSDLIRQKQEKDLLETELKLLQAQIEPHFLFNTLSNVISLIHVDPDAAEKALLNLTTLLRASLNRTREASVTFEEELTIVKAYLEIQGIRMQDRLRYQFDPPDHALSKDLLEWHLPPLLLQPIIENAVKHGIDPSETGGQILISMHLNDNCLVIEVIDNGMGIDAALASKSENTGTGLNNVRGRLKALYGDAASLTVSDNIPNGLKVKLTIPASSS